jgi:type I restriction enzyme M protein
MPSNIFANTGTNVSIIFIDKSNDSGMVVLVDASGLGTKIKEGKNQKTLLSSDEEKLIIDTVNGCAVADDFSIVKTFDELKAVGYSFNPGTYFEVKIERAEMTTDEFAEEMEKSKAKLAGMFLEAEELHKIIIAGFGGLEYE